MGAQRTVVNVHRVMVIGQWNDELLFRTFIHPYSPIILVHLMRCVRAVQVDVEPVLVDQVVDVAVTHGQSSSNGSSWPCLMARDVDGGRH